MENKVVLYKEYRFVEKPDTEIDATWKGAHVLLFFLAFVFGFFCCFCFHMLAYLFGDKCVLFPDLQKLENMRHNIIYDLSPHDKAKMFNMSIDLVIPRWANRSLCNLPTFVPLGSGILGLVWTTMFLMFNTAGVAHTGLQRAWRVLPAVFVTSVVMSVLCSYTSIVTYSGLQQLCSKLSEITGTTSCTYAINVATLAYERRIRGVYQATRLTIISAWLHTFCWMLSALLVLLRVALAVDFQLVCITVTLKGNIDKLLEQNEKQISVTSPQYDRKIDRGAQEERLIPEGTKETPKMETILAPELAESLPLPQKHHPPPSFLQELKFKEKEKKKSISNDLKNKETPRLAANKMERTIDTLPIPDDEQRQSRKKKGEIDKKRSFSPEQFYIIDYDSNEIITETAKPATTDNEKKIKHGDGKETDEPALKKPKISDDSEEFTYDGPSTSTALKSSLKSRGAQTDEAPAEAPKPLTKVVHISEPEVHYSDTNIDEKDEIEKARKDKIN